MRTLKKTLCLVLCLAMMVGLCAFGASAETYGDAAEIENKEAVGLLTGLGVMIGVDNDGDGEAEDFDPAGTLNRAQAAAIIYRLLTAKTEAPAEASTVFTDMAGYGWATGYIAYCYDAGIIAGYGDGKFGPGDPVTGAQFGKMLLCALGYDAEKEGLTGKGWDLNTTVLVKRTELATATEFGTGSDPITRDFAAKMSFNALTVPMVEYDSLFDVTAGDVTISSNEDRVVTGDFLAENFGLQVVQNKAAGAKDEAKHPFQNTASAKGVVVGNSANKLAGAVTTLSGGAVAVAESGEELLGRYVAVYYDKEGNVISMTEIGSAVEVEAPIKANDSAAFKDTFGSTKVNNGTVYRFENDGVGSSSTYKISADTATAAGTYVFDDQGNLVAELFDTYKVVTLELVKEVNDTADKGYIEFASGLKLERNSAKNEVRTELETIAAKDIVVVTKCGEVYTITEPEIVEGAISKYDTAAPNAITLEGTAYPASGATDNVGATGKIAPAAITAAQMKANTYTAYMVDGEYVRIVEKSAEVAPFTAYYVIEKTEKDVLKNDEVIHEVYARVVDLTGAESTVLVKTGAKGTDNVAGFVGQVVKITDDTTNGVKKLEAFAAADLAKYDATITAVNPISMAAKANAINNGSYVKDDSNFIFVDFAGTKKAVEVKTGALVMDAAKGFNAQVVTIKDKDNNQVVKAAFIGKAYEATVVVDLSTTIYVAPSTVYDSATADGYIYTVYDVTTGDAKSITMKADDALTGKHGFYSFSEKDGITSVSAYTIDKDATGAAIASMADSFRLGAKYTGKYESSIRVDLLAGDHNAASAIFKDLRKAADITVGKVTDVASLEAEKANVVIDVLFTGTASDAAAIFVRK